MLPLIFAFLRTLCGTAGGILVLVGLCAGRSEAGKVQSVVLKFWVDLTAFGEQATTRHARVVQGTAKAALSVLEWIFGPQILSLQCIWTATWLSISSSLLTISLAAGVLYSEALYRVGWVPPLFAAAKGADPSVVAHGVAASLGLMIIAMWPALLARGPHRWARISVAAVPLLWRTTVGFAYGVNSHPPVDVPPAPTHSTFAYVVTIMVICCWLATGTLTDLVMLQVVRWSLRKCKTADKWRSGLAALCVIIPFPFIFSGAPVYFVRHVGGVLITIPALVLIATIPMNLFDIMFTVALSGWLLVLLVHKLAWPVFGGLVERVYEMLPDRKALVAAGVALLALSGWASTRHLLQKVGELFLAH